ncbi:MAG TPA: hypothetical protein VF893_07600 [Candidatus Bathyarchaeia archaeon]
MTGAKFGKSYKIKTPLRNHMRFKRKRPRLNNGTPTIDVDNLISDTTRTERFRVFELLSSNRKSLVILLMVSGAFSAAFAVQFAFGGQTSLLVLIGMIFIGFANLVVGLVLLASE